MTTTTWPAVRETLVTVVAGLLGCAEDLVRWNTDSQPINDLQARLSVVSEIPEADARREVDPDTLEVTLYESVRLNVQVLIETSDGEFPENTTDAQTHATRLRLALQHDNIVDALKDAGIVMVTRPGPIRPVDYEDRESTYWICARAFELPLRVTYEHAVPGFTVTEMTRVIGEGENVDVEFDVEDPS